MIFRAGKEPTRQKTGAVFRKEYWMPQNVYVAYRLDGTSQKTFHIVVHAAGRLSEKKLFLAHCICASIAQKGYLWTKSYIKSKF